MNVSTKIMMVNVLENCQSEPETQKKEDGSEGRLLNLRPN